MSELILRQHIRMWWRRWQHHAPEWRLNAIEFGRKHAGTPHQAAREWQRLRAILVEPGMEDLRLIGPQTYVAIETKWGAGKLSPVQEAWQDHLAACGFPYHTARSVADVAGILRATGVPLSRLAMEDAEGEDRAIQAAPKPAKRVKPEGKGPRPVGQVLRVLANARAKGVFV